MSIAYWLVLFNRNLNESAAITFCAQPLINANCTGAIVFYIECYEQITILSGKEIVNIAIFLLNLHFHIFNLSTHLFTILYNEFIKWFSEHHIYNILVTADQKTFSLINLLLQIYLGYRKSLKYLPMLKKRNLWRTDREEHHL